MQETSPPGARRRDLDLESDKVRSHHTTPCSKITLCFLITWRVNSKFLPWPHSPPGLWPWPTNVSDLTLPHSPPCPACSSYAGPLLSHKHANPVPTSGPLHVQFPAWNESSVASHLAACGSTFRSWLRCHLLRGVLLTTPSKVGLLVPCYPLLHHPACLPLALIPT